MYDNVNVEDWEKLVTHPLLGEILLQRKKITISQLDVCLKEQAIDNRPLGELLVKNDFISDEDLMELLALQTEIDNLLTQSIIEIKNLSKGK